MATVITRTIASTPHRTAGETWDKIMAIIAPDPKSAGRAELQKVSGVASSSIASEVPLEDAFIVYGQGPQIRIYCVFGDDAISGDCVNEEPFEVAPATGDWRMSIPCLPEDLDWSERKLKSDSTRVTARATGEKVEESKGSRAQGSNSLSLDVSEFLKP